MNPVDKNYQLLITLKLKIFSIECFRHNIKSLNLAKRLGFEFKNVEPAVFRNKPVNLETYEIII